MPDSRARESSRSRQKQAIDTAAQLDERNKIQKFPAGTHFTAETLSTLGRDVLLAGWVGLAQPGSAESTLIGVLLPGDRIGTVLDPRLCTAIALTPISLTSEDINSNAMREINHLIRQCARMCHLNALDRVEDFFLESYERLESVELASGRIFEFPLPQAILGNILGLSAAHVNRVIKQLQVLSRIKMVGRMVTLLDHANIAASVPPPPES